MTDRLRVIVNHALARAEPSPEAEAVSDVLFGERVTKLESGTGFVRIRNEYDGYEGWVREEALGPDTAQGPLHRVRPRLASAFDAPGGQAVIEDIGVGSPVYPQSERDGWVQDAGGLWFRAGDLVKVPYAGDPVEVALEFIGVPYVWGGRHGGGIDCSGLVQIGAMLAGRACARDTKDQVNSYGTLIGGFDAPDRKRGDVLYVPGHVAILTGPYEAVHADGKAGLVHVQDLETIVRNRGHDLDAVTIRRPTV